MSTDPARPNAGATGAYQPPAQGSESEPDAPTVPLGTADLPQPAGTSVYEPSASAAAPSDPVALPGTRLYGPADTGATGEYASGSVGLPENGSAFDVDDGVAGATGACAGDGGAGSGFRPDDRFGWRHRRLRPERPDRAGPRPRRPAGIAVRALRPQALPRQGGHGRGLAGRGPGHRPVGRAEADAGPAARPAARFRVEAQVTGQLEHPGIVPVHELGTNEQGLPFYVMKFVQGRTLQKVIEEFHERRPTPAPARWSRSDCSRCSSRSARRSPTPTAGACSTAT